MGSHAAPSASARPLDRPFVRLAASLSLIVASAVAFAALAPVLDAHLSRLGTWLRAQPDYAGLALAVVALNGFEAVVHVANAWGLWFGRALSDAPWVLRLSQHTSYLERQRSLREYLALNALDVLGFVAAFAVLGRFSPWLALLFGPHLATMLLAAWDLDVFVKLYLLDLRRYLPPDGLASRWRRIVLEGHLFMRGAFVLGDAVVRTILCVEIVRTL